MNFSEFKKLLGADPLNQDEEVLAARRSNPEFEQAARDAEAFESKLSGALNFPLDADELLQDVLRAPQDSRRGLPRWMAMAASVLVVVGIASIALHQAGKPGTLEEYVEYHYRHDGEQVLAKAMADFDPAEVNALLARFNASAAPELVGRVNFLKLCPTLHGKGAHMIISSSRGPVTVIYMPDTEVEDSLVMQFDGFDANYVSLEAGSAVIINIDTDDYDAGIEALLRNSIKPLTADA